MKIVVVMANKKDADILISRLKSKFGEMVSFQYVTQGRDLIGDIKKEAPDLLMTVNLEGFERETLTDNIAYNFLECKQVHFLLERNLANEHYLSKMLSIAMFFYCKDEVYKEELLQKYKDLPWIKSLGELGGSPVGKETKDAEKSNRMNEQECEKVYEAIWEVIKEGKINI